MVLRLRSEGILLYKFTVTGSGGELPAGSPLFPNPGKEWGRSWCEVEKGKNKSAPALLLHFLSARFVSFPCRIPYFALHLASLIGRKKCSNVQFATL